MNNNRLRNGYLDERDNADKFREEQLARATELIYSILDVTTGFCVPPCKNSEFGHANFLELLEIFKIRHKNFSVQDFAEHLQDFVYRYTSSYERGFEKWRDEIFTSKGLDDEGEPLPERSKVLDLSSQTEYLNITKECLDLAKHLSAVLTDPNTPASISNAIFDEVYDKSEAYDTPESIAQFLCKKGENE